eukprot:759529-Hanusia_phi.AAC.6
MNHYSSKLIKQSDPALSISYHEGETGEVEGEREAGGREKRSGQSSRQSQLVRSWRGRME